MLSFSSESSDDEWLRKAGETVISKIISDQKIDDNESPEYQLCHVSKYEPESKENYSLLLELFNITTQTIVPKPKFKDFIMKWNPLYIFKLHVYI